LKIFHRSSYARIAAVEDGWKICQLLMIRTKWKVRISLAVEIVNHPIPSLKAILALVSLENQMPGILRALIPEIRPLIEADYGICGLLTIFANQ
jgi:hypothetical protein